LQFDSIIAEGGGAPSFNGFRKVQIKHPPSCAATIVE